MTRLQQLVYTSAIVLAFSLLSISSSRADLLALDWKIPGDTKLTLDTVTGLEWLDVTETAGLSYNQSVALTTPGNVLDTFRPPTTNEIINFIENQNITVQGSGLTGEEDLINRYMDFVGTTMTNELGRYTQAFAQPVSADVNPTMVHISARFDNFTEALILSGNLGPDADWIDAGHSTYMVRPSSRFPKIDGLWPNNAVPGDIVFMFGNNFPTSPDGPIEVCINMTCTFIVQLVTNELLLFSLPESPLPATVSLRTRYGTAVSNDAFPISCAGLCITSIWPGTINIGSILFIFGEGFDAGPVSVFINGTQTFANHVAAPDLILSLVPGGVSSGNVQACIQDQCVVSPTPVNISQ